MTFTTARGVNLAELRAALKLWPMAEFAPDKPARIYDNLNERFFEWDPKNAEHYRQTVRPFGRCALSAPHPSERRNGSLYVEKIVGLFQQRDPPWDRCLERLAGGEYDADFRIVTLNGLNQIEPVAAR